MVADKKTEKHLQELMKPVNEKRLLSPVDRISEILFGLIMALTFTCTISVIDADRAEVKGMLIGAIGCNIAWGLVDAVMYILITLTEKSRSVTILNFIRKSTDRDKSNQIIADALPPLIASQMNAGELDVLREKLLKVPDSISSKLTWVDFKMSIGIFLLVFLSTFPVALPFIFISELQTALRVSNAVAIVMMFFCGWYLAKYSGRNAFVMGILMSLIGIVLVLATIALGG